MKKRWKAIIVLIIIQLMCLTVVLYDYSSYLGEFDPYYQNICIKFPEGSRFPVRNYVQANDLPETLNAELLDSIDSDYIWTTAQNLESNYKDQLYSYITLNRSIEDINLFHIYLNSIEHPDYGCGLADISLNKYSKPYSELTKDEFIEIVNLIKNQSD